MNTLDTLSREPFPKHSTLKMGSRILPALAVSVVVDPRTFLGCELIKAEIPSFESDDVELFK